MEFKWESNLASLEILDNQNWILEIGYVFYDKSNK